MATYNVISEHYAVFDGKTEISKHDSPTDAIYKAMELTGKARSRHVVKRITVIDTTSIDSSSFDSLFVPDGGCIVTGTWSPDVPAFGGPELSRYHPNNGWVLPKTLDV